MTLINEKARIVGNACVGPDLYLMALSSPRIARAVMPGQFVHMKVPGMETHILRRPFSVYARDAEAGVLEILYQVVGFGSAHMAKLKPGRPLSESPKLIGPVGRAWQVPEGAEKALLVGGGVGAAPLFMLAESLVADGLRIDVVLGAQTRSALPCRGRYEALLAEAPACEGGPRCSTDDGSFGRAGFCTSLVEEALAGAAARNEAYGYLAACGPEALMRRVAKMAADAEVPCEVSMERRMACGIGACLSCVVDTRGGRQRACVDGPIFDAREVVW